MGSWRRCFTQIHKHTSQVQFEQTCVSWLVRELLGTALTLGEFVLLPSLKCFFHCLVSVSSPVIPVYTAVLLQECVSFVLHGVRGHPAQGCLDVDWMLLHFLFTFGHFNQSNLQWIQINVIKDSTHNNEWYYTVHSHTIFVESFAPEHISTWLNSARGLNEV